MENINIIHPSTSIKTKAMIKNGEKKLKRNVVSEKKKSEKNVKKGIKKKANGWRLKKNVN